MNAPRSNGDRTVPLRAGQPGRDRRVRGVGVDRRSRRAGPTGGVDTGGNPGCGGRFRDPPGAGRAVPGPGQAPSTGEGVHLFAGLKGAVPILLASYLLPANIPQGARLYGIVVVVVVFSVLVQGTLVPTVARALRLPMRTVQPEPWALGSGCAPNRKASTASPSPGSPADGR